MTTAVIRKRLAKYVETADDKKIKAVYTLLENEIEQAQYSDEFKEELDRRYAHYLNGGEMLSEKEVEEILNSI